MAKYKIEVPNKTYNGITEGVAFVSGYGETDDETIKNTLINDYGYKVCCEDKEEKKAEAPKSAPKKPTNNRKSSAK